MRKRILGSLLLLVVLFGGTASARAGVLNDFGRYLGWGWSDGYHARSAYPPADPPPTYYAPSPAPRASAPAPTMPAMPAAPAPAVRKAIPVLPSRHATPLLIPLSR